MSTGLNVQRLQHVELTSSNCSVMAACEASVSPARHSCKIPRKIPMAPNFGCVRTSWLRWTFTHSRNNLSRTWSNGRARVISLMADRRSSMTYKQKFTVTHFQVITDVQITRYRSYIQKKKYLLIRYRMYISSSKVPTWDCSKSSQRD